MSQISSGGKYQQPLQTGPLGNQSGPLIDPENLQQTSNPQQTPGLQSPDQLRQKIPTGNLPVLPILGQQDPIQAQATQVRATLTQGDHDLLARYDVSISTNSQGIIANFSLHGRPATDGQVGQHLKTYQVSVTHDLTNLQQQANQEYQSFVGLVNGLFNQLNQGEQTSVKIQLQAINVLYASFASRLSQIGAVMYAN